MATEQFLHVTGSPQSSHIRVLEKPLLFKRRITSASHATLLASVTLGNIAVWGIEQIIDIEFEFLSISYIITELFLLMLYIMLQAQEHTANTESEASGKTKQIPVPQAVEETEAAETTTANTETEEILTGVPVNAGKYSVKVTARVIYS